MAASVWINDSTPLAPSPRALALTIPAVTVEPKLNGLPTASTHSPTFKRSESPTGMAGKSSPSILTNAKSVVGSVPITRPFISRPSCNLTEISSAPSIT